MNTYLIDSNCLITPKNNYYPFDFAKSFWRQLSDKIRENHAVILKAVYDEIINVAKPDDLSKWLKNQPELKPLKVDNVPEILIYYGKVLQYIQAAPRYNKKAFDEWANVKVADAWLIAAAMHFGYTVVTLEIPSGQALNSVSGRARIPDVAAYFNVECITLFDFMRQMNFKL